MDAMFDEDDFDRLETEEQPAPTMSKRRQSGFAYCLDACGLSTDEAMKHFGLSRSAIWKKRTGERPMTRQEAERFASLWHDIRTFRIKDLPEGAQDAAYAMLILSGKKMPSDPRRGRQRVVPLDEAAAAERVREENAAAMAAAVESVLAKRKAAKADRDAEMAQLLASAVL